MRRKGGTLVLANPNRLTSFDKFNPFTLRGNPAPGVGLMFESLTTGSCDEVASAYGLLADDISIAPDGLSTTFHINPARAFFERRSGHRRRRQIFVRHAEKPAGRAAIRVVFRRDHARGGGRSA